MSINPANVTYTNREPYITVDEFINSPIASAVDVTNLVPNGNIAAQNAAIQQLIYMASAEADNIVMGPLGTMCATSNTEQGRYRVNRSGMIIVHPAYWPILEVDSFLVGALPGNQVSIPVSSATCWIEDRQFTIMGSTFPWSSNGPIELTSVPFNSDMQQFVTYSYVNGFFNQFLSASSSAGATSLTIPSPIGLYPGMPFTIWDGAMTEIVQVSSTWTSSTTVTLQNPTTYAHSSGTNVSTLPASVKQAVIHLVVAGIKQRGEGGLVIAETGEPMSVGGRSDTAVEDLMRAEELLHAFLQVWGRS